MKRAKLQSSLDMSTHTDEESGGSDVGSDTESTIFSMDPTGVVINDAVHGSIVLPTVCMAVVDTKEFQRLRALKQCGICHMVYPSAVHSRFEHSIGVCHWARVFLKNCGASVSDDKKLCVLLAGLCHDLGHGPFSHLWERFLLKCGVEWKHEANSVVILKALIANNNLRSVFRKYGLEEEHIEMIFRLIAGNPPEGEQDLFLYEIIANSANGLDVDKFEYIMRDSKQFGMNFTLAIDRIVNNVCVVEYEGARHVGFREKISDTLLEVFQQRAKLHKTCYQHIACKAVELMLIDALFAANQHFLISWKETSFGEDGTEVSEIRHCKLSECHDFPEAFLKATDCLFQDLLNSTSPELEESRSLLEAMLQRDLYTLVFHKVLKKVSPSFLAVAVLLASAFDVKTSSSGRTCSTSPKALANSTATARNDGLTYQQGSEELKRVGNEIVDRLNDSVGKQYSCSFRSCLKNYGIGQSWSKVLFFEKQNPGKPFRMSTDDIKQTSFIGDCYNCNELLVFCTKGKKSMTDGVLNTIKTCATNIFNTLAQDGVFQEVSSQ